MSNLTEKPSVSEDRVIAIVNDEMLAVTVKQNDERTKDLLVLPTLEELNIKNLEELNMGEIQKNLGGNLSVELISDNKLVNLYVIAFSELESISNVIYIQFDNIDDFSNSVYSNIIETDDLTMFAIDQIKQQLSDSIKTRPELCKKTTENIRQPKGAE